MKKDRVNLGIDFSVDKSGLEELKKELRNIRILSKTTGMSDELKEAAQAADKLEDILNQSWNSKLGQLDLSKLNKGIKESYGGINRLKQAMVSGGKEGALAYNNFARSVLGTNLQLKQSSKILDDMAQTMGNTVKWGVTSSIFNTMTGSIEKAWSFTKQLDSSLNDIRIVTGKSADEMGRFAKQANKAAKELGASTRDYTEASLIFYQQGLSDEEVKARAETTLKAANVTGQRGEEVSQQLTAVWNGYKVSAEEAELYIDKLAAVAAATAADLEELSTGMSKVASAANLMGVDIDQLNAQLATIVSVTRQAPESVGTALKTIYARMGDIKSGISDETTLDEYTKQMAEMGVNVLDTNGRLRDMGEVIEEIGSKWTSMSREQQIALSQTMAGTRQYNNLLSLFDNWDMYEEALKTSGEAAGTLQKQQDIYMESTEAHLQKLRTEAEETYGILFDADTVNSFADGLTGVLSVFNNFLAGLGGGSESFLFFGTTVANIFNKQIGSAIERQINNLHALKANTEAALLKQSIIDQHSAAGQDLSNAAALEKEMQYAQKTLAVKEILTEEEYEQFTLQQQEIGNLEQQIKGIEEYKKISEEILHIKGDQVGIEDFENRIKDETDLLQIEKERYYLIRKNISEYQSKTRKKDRQDNAESLLREISIPEGQKEEYASILSKITDKRKLSELEVNKILDLQRKNRQEQIELIKVLERGAQGLADDEAGIYADLLLEQEAREGLLQQQQAEKDRQLAISESIQGVTALIGILQGATGILKTITDDTISGGEKLQRIFTVIGGLIPSIVMNFKSIKDLMKNMAVATGAVQTSAQASTMSFMSLGKAMIGPALKFLPIAAGVVAALGAIAAAVWYITEKTQEQEKELKRLEEAQKGFVDNYNKLTEKADTLNKSFDKYKDIIATLASCQKGTVEWTKSLQEANKETLSILEKYPDLAKIKNLFTYVDGKQLINTDVVDEYIKGIEEAALNSQRGSLLTQQLISQKKLTIKQEDVAGQESQLKAQFQRDFQQTVQSTQVSLEDLNEQVDQYISATKNATDEEIQAVFEETNVSKYFVDELIEYQKQVKDLGESTQEVSTQMLNTAKALGGSLGGDADSVITDVLQGQESSEIFKKEQEKWKKKLTGSGISKASGGSNKIYRQFLEQLQGISGYENAESVRNAVRGSDFNRELVVRIDNEEIIKSADAWAAILATAESSNLNLKEILDKSAEIENRFIKTFGENGAIIANAIFGGDLTSLTEKQIKMIQDVINNKKGDLLDLFKDDKLYKQLGYDSAQAALEGLEEKIGEWSPKKFAETSSKSLQAAYRSIAEEFKMSSEEVSLFGEAIIKNNPSIKENTGEIIKLTKASVKFRKELEELADQTEQEEKILEKWAKSEENAANISLSTVEAVGALKAQMKELFGIDFSEEFLKDNFGLLQDIIQGDTDALDELERKVNQQYLINIGIDYSTYDNLSDIQYAFDTLTNQDLEVGVALNDERALKGLQSFLVQAKLTKDQATNILSQFGFEGELEEIKAPDQEIETTNYTPYVIGYKSFPVYSPALDPDLPAPVTQYRFPQIGQKAEPSKTKIKGTSYWVLKGKSAPNTTKVPNMPSFSGLGGTVKSTGKGAAASSIVSGLGSRPSKKPSKSRGGSKKDPKILDHLEKEHDRYHDINIEISQIETNLKRLEKQQNKLFGKDLIDNLNKQLKQLDKQIDNYNKKIKIAQKEAVELRDKLAKRGVSFDSDQTITNYAEIYKKQLDYTNSIIDKYNKMDATAQEKYEKTVNKAKEDFDLFVKELERYDDLIVSEIPGLEDSIQEMLDKQIGIQIDQFNMEIELRLKMGEAEKDWNEFKKQIIDGIEETDILGNAKADLKDFFIYYKEQDRGIIQANAQHIRDTLAQLKQMDETGTSNVYGDNRKQALDDLQNYYQQLMSDLRELEDLQDKIHGSYLEMMDEAQEKFDEQINSFGLVSDILEHDMNLISLLKGEDAFKDLATYFDKQRDNYNKQLDFQRKQVDFWRAQMEAAEEGSKEWDSAREKWTAAVQDLNSTIEESIQNLQDKYLNALNSIFQDLNNKVTKGMGLDYVETQWELINKNADQYLDTINAAYGIQQLENKYLDAIDQTDSVSAQRQLNKLKEEQIKALREQDKLTQYDVDRANLKYEIALKQIALQEAQQNKTSMRLRRDSQGNYSYQFVADQDAIGQLQDELDALNNDLYNFDLNRYKENLGQLYDVWVEYQERMKEAAQINDPKLRAEKELLLQEEYGELINGIVAQNATVRNNLQESAFADLSILYDKDLEDFQNMTDAEREIIMNELVPQWNSGIQEMADTFASEGGFTEVCKDAMNQIRDLTVGYENDLKELQESAKVNFDEISKGIDQTIQNTQDLIKNNSDLINGYKDELDAVKAVIDELDNLIIKYQDARKEALSATEAAYKYWQEQNRQAAENAKKDQASKGNTPANTGTSNTNQGNKGSGSQDTKFGSGDGVLNVGDTATFNGSYYYDSFGTAPAGSRYSGVAKGVIVDIVNNNPYGAHIHSADGKYMDLGWVKKQQLKGYDTGGYTGNWNNKEGKLALLHKKELVLNENDTTNILNAVEILRNINSIILDKIGKMTMSSIQKVGGKESDLLEQNVHIDASFPGVQDSKEIEQAFDNLINIASQKIGRKKDM